MSVIGNSRGKPAMKLAYFIMVHKNAAQIDKLIDSIDDGENYILIHADKRSPQSFHDELARVVDKYPNARLMPSQTCGWAGWSLVRVALAGIETLLNWADDWHFWINLSGQDFALRPQSQIKEFLRERLGVNFMYISKLREWPAGMKRISQYYLELPFKKIGRPVPTFIPRNFLPNVEPYTGMQWMTLSREFCEYAVRDPAVEKFRTFYRYSLVPDEMFFQTVLMDSPFAATLDHNYRRYIPKFHGQSSPRILTMQDFDTLMASDGFFARKFDSAVDPEIIDRLLAHAKSGN